jgi:hypothetical protein
MTRENFERSLAAFWRRRPFRPFVVELVSGERIKADHPEALVLRGGSAGYVSADGTPALFDHEGVRVLVGDGKRRSA